MQFIVIGLGIYGEILARRLTDLGHEVIGADSHKERVDDLAPYLSGTICLDARNADAISVLPLDKADAVIVSIGSDFAASVQTVARLKQLGVKRIIARGLDNLHIGVLQTLGVERVTFPESIGADALAESLSLAGYKSSCRIDSQHFIFQVQIPQALVGKQLKDASLEAYNLKVVTIKTPTKVKNLLLQTHTEMVALSTVEPTTELVEGDVLVLYGETKDFDTFSKNIR